MATRTVLETSSSSSSSREKLEATHVEKTGGSTAIQTADNDEHDVPEYDDKEKDKILRKIDWRLLPVLTILYLLAFIDRGNIGNAKVAGMNTDLELTGNHTDNYKVFFLTYATLEVPCNLILKMFKRPSYWICLIMTSWGIIMTCMGVVKGFTGLWTTRLLLGVFEAGFFPAATYLLTVWYVRWEVQSRLAIFFSTASMAGAFSGLLAFALSQMDGIGGLAGWRWIFIMEGIVTVALGVAVPWILPDSPQLCTFLTPAEKAFIDRRLARDSGTEHGKLQTQEGYQFSSVKNALLDWKIWFCCLIYNGGSIPIYGFTYTVPTIITELGYTGQQAQLLTMPPYFCGAIATVVFSYLADKKRIRWPFIVIPYSIALIGFIGLISIPHPRYPGLTYGLLFLIPIGVYPPIVALISWVGNNLSPTWKRATGMALLITLGNYGGAIGSNIFLQKQKPHYWLGYGFSIGILAVAIVSTFIIRWTYLRINKSRDSMDLDEIRARYTEQELLEMGDKSPLYRYVL
ncbi:hypothetical protein PMZ80_008870 [Knufia obscura]|uniref:Major facilitator superfamily (MFS) profile domain-containing protein n=1 Tax=Knufia obscura TaxID=1635080 RepID=A0ABR0REY5_9EURO|nr:hypothetical protein PMZ80_008870 [Knufia obscura]